MVIMILIKTSDSEASIHSRLRINFETFLSLTYINMSS